jgi:carboxylesterase type B
MDIIYVAFILFLTGVSAQAPPVVNLGYVKYTGAQNTTAGLNYYRGIRYAQSPEGDLRCELHFSDCRLTSVGRAPVPIESNSSYVGQTLNASQSGPSCYQGAPIWGGNGIFEAYPTLILDEADDCLLLDIVTPMNPVSDNLPVVFQIHGGGYTEGSTLFGPGDAFVNKSNGTVIWVSIQYRLGMFGFMGGSQIAENGVRNAGLLDQRAALDWVQRHISAFGGDPSKVTIMGINNMSVLS